jgi:hypothetical protein
MKVSDNFDIRELVHPDIWGSHKERCIDFVNVNTGETLEAIKKELSNMINKTESVTVNDWLWDGRYVNSGIRYNFGSERSTHRVGCGFDLKYKHHTPQEVYLFIIQNQELFPYISRMEHIDATPKWNHIEICTEKRIGKIYVFKP